MKNLCQLPELGLSCMGCCGRDYGSKKDIEKGLVANTLSFLGTDDKVKWGKRYEGTIRQCGICFNLVREEKEIFCPLHPARNNGKDLRDNVCDKGYMCKTFHLFKNEWDDKTRKAFLNFIKKKNLDWYSYSIGMDSDKFLKEFLELLD